MRVAVVGAGIAGLVAADAVARMRPDIDVLVLEQSGRVGGKLRSGELAGHRIDLGAEALLARRPEGIELLARLGVADDRIDPLTAKANLWIDGSLRPVPTGTVMGVPGDVEAVAAVLSEATLSRIRAEADRDEPPLTDDVSVGGLVAARFGQEVVDRIVDPLLAGVYAGRAERISLRAALPELARELTEQGGSLLRATQAITARTAGRASDTPVFTSLPAGIGRIPELLAQAGRFTVQTDTAVREITRIADGFRLAIGARPDGRHLDADAVIVAAPAPKAAALLGELAPVAATELAGVRMASMAIVSFAFPDHGDLPAGSGVLVPATSGRAVKAITISSQKWPGAPSGLAFVRASIGRIGEEALLQRDDADLIELARRDLEDLLGVAVTPIDALVTRWGGGLPQYDVGHLDRVLRVRESVAGVPGLAVAGATFDGIGIPACIRSAQLAADRVVGALSPSGQ